MKTVLLPKILPRTAEQRRAEAYRELLREQAKMGGELFGPVPADRRREFFCLDEYTWVWHEEWQGANGERQALTTRYDIRPQGVLKSQGGNSYQKVTGAELRNLYQAACLYRDRLGAQLQYLQQQV
jgi:hypothetical protein